VWDWDVATGRLAWEGRLEEIHGMRPGTFDGTLEGFLAAIHPDDRERARREIEAALERRSEDFAVEFRTLGHDGRIRWVTGEGRVVCDPGGRPVRMVGVGRDVTAERVAQQALAESEARFRLMADSAPVMIWVAAETGARIYFNEPWLRFTGRSVEQEMRDGWVEGVHPDDRGRCLEACRAALASREPFELEYRLRRADGRFRWILDRGVPRRAGGSFAGFVGSCVEIHDRRRAAEAQELLARIGAALLDRPLSHEERLAALGELLIPAVADACLITVRGGEAPPRWFAEPPDNPASAVLLGLVDAFGDDPPGAAPRDGRPVLLVEDEPGAWAADRGEAAREAGVRGVIVAPLRARGHDVGSLALAVTDASGRTFDDDDLELARQIARRAALAIDNARLFEAERTSAERLRFLADAGRVLGSSLDYRRTLDSLASLAVPRLADWCAIDIVEDGALRSVAIAHADPERVRWARELRERYPPDPDADTGSVAVVRAGVPELVPSVTDAMVAAVARDEEHRELLRRVGLRSYLCVPLEARGRVLGALTLIQAESGRRLGEADLVLAGQLAGRAAAAIDNARLFEGQRHIAHTLQAALLPPELPQPPGAEVAGAYLPMGEGIEAGGDFYDVFEAVPGRWCVAIGDVCGKGPRAAALAALARYALRALSRRHAGAAALVEDLNAEIRREVHHDMRFLTGCIGLLRRDDDAFALELACAGHPDPLMVRADGSLEWLPGTGHPLGLAERAAPAVHRLRLLPGDRLLLYTDGVTEARAGDRFFDRDGIEAAVAACAGGGSEDLVEAVIGALRRFRPQALRDDVAVLALGAAPRPGTPAGVGLRSTRPEDPPPPGHPESPPASSAGARSRTVASTVSDAMRTPAASKRSCTRRVSSSFTERAVRTGTMKRADSSIQLSVARTKTRGSSSARGTGNRRDSSSMAARAPSVAEARAASSRMIRSPSRQSLSYATGTESSSQMCSRAAE